MEMFMQLYLPVSEFEAGKLLFCIEVLEAEKLIPVLQYNLTGPENNLNKRQKEVKAHLIKDRLNWLDESIKKHEKVDIYSDFEKEEQASLTVSTSFIKFKGQNKDTFVFNLMTKNAWYSAELIERAVSSMQTAIVFYWGDVSPRHIVNKFTKQIVRPHEKERIPEYTLPIVKMPQFLSGPNVPFSFGWINYWSKETVREIGLDINKDQEYFFKIVSTENGGVILQITEEELNLEDPKHIAALLKAYDRFPKVGGRDTPFDYLK